MQGHGLKRRSAEALHALPHPLDERRVLAETLPVPVRADAGEARAPQDLGGVGRGLGVLVVLLVGGLRGRETDGVLEVRDGGIIMKAQVEDLRCFRSKGGPPGS